LKIDQFFAKLLTRVGCLVFWLTVYNTYTTHSVSYWRAKWPSVHKHQQPPTKL